MDHVTLDVILGEAMQAVWDEFSGDTNTHPDCIELQGNKVKGTFLYSRFAFDVAERVKGVVKVSESEQYIPKDHHIVEGADGCRYVKNTIKTTHDKRSESN